jgi:VanZ family protein
MRVLLLVVLGATVVAIVAGSLVSGMAAWPPGLSPGLAHFLAYTVLGVLMTLAFRSRRYGVVRAFLLTALIGTGVEFSQMLVPVRTFSLFDLGINVVGAGFGVLVGWLFGVLVGRWGRRRVRL